MIYLSTKVQVWLRLKKKFENEQWLVETNTELEPWEHVLASGVVIQELQHANSKKNFLGFYRKNYEGEFEIGCVNTQNFLLSLSLLRVWNNCSENRSHFQKLLMWRAEKERKKTSSKIPLLLFQTRGNQPCFRTALWGSDGTSLSCPSPHLNIFILVPTFISCWFRPARAEWVTVFCISPPAEECWSSTSSVAGLEGQAGCEQEWLVECKGGEMEEKKKCSLCFGQYVCSTSRWELWACAIWFPARWFSGAFLNSSSNISAWQPVARKDFMVLVRIPHGAGLQQMKCKRLVEGAASPEVQFTCWSC